MGRAVQMTLCGWSARVQLHRHLGALATALWAPACLKKHSFCLENTIKLAGVECSDQYIRNNRLWQSVIAG